MLALNTSRVGASVKDGPTERHTSPENRKFPPFAPAHRPSFHSPHTPTNREKVQAKVAERVLQIQALETRISYLGGTLGVESQEAEAAVNAKVADLEAQIHSLKQENSYATSVLSDNEYNKITPPLHRMSARFEADSQRSTTKR